jgi:hypothetical protein
MRTDELELALVVVLADADLKRLVAVDQFLLDRAAKHAAVVIGRSELRVGHVAMRVEVD